MFGGAPNVIFGPEFGLKNAFALSDATLDARVGAPDPANADTGQLTTGEPDVNQLGIPVTWGRGRDNWRELDLALLHPFLTAMADAPLVGGANAGPDIYLVSGAIVNGNLILTFHNRGAAGSMIFFRITYEISLVR